ncbi:hypothetical protein EV401DRAFT_1894097 [Pisolithus croceorrhizus]|nr:hypothetical protein EV401DRAFT_1894097 [Pisolithus croceorrhizus]
MSSQCTGPGRGNETGTMTGVDERKGPVLLTSSTTLSSFATRGNTQVEMSTAFLLGRHQPAFCGLNISAYYEGSTRTRAKSLAATYLSLRSVIVSLRRLKFVFLPRRAMEGTFNIELAKMVDDAILTACARHTTRHEATIESMKVHIWEVSRFNQPKDFKKNAPEVEDKFRPILEAKANVNVVLFCMRGQKLTGMTMRIFELIHSWDMQDCGGGIKAYLERVSVGPDMSVSPGCIMRGMRENGESCEELVAVLIEYGPSRGRTAVPLEPALRDYLGRSGQTDGDLALGELCSADFVLDIEGWMYEGVMRLTARDHSAYGTTLRVPSWALTVSLATVCWSKGAKNATGCAAVNALDGGLEYLEDVRGATSSLLVS